MKANIIDYSKKCIVIKTDEKPSRPQITALKLAGGRFNSNLSCGAGWVFPKTKAEKVAELVAVINGEKVGSPAPSPTVKQKQIDDKALLDEYGKEIAKRYRKDSNLYAYYLKRVSAVIRLSNGGLMAFDKPHIKTEFCFGYGYGTTSEEAHKRANIARTQPEYFLAQNLDEIDERIHALETNCKDYRYGDKWYIHKVGCHNEWDVYEFNTAHDYDVKQNPHCYDGYIPMSDNDRIAIINQLKIERTKFEKRLHTYLKKYGLSKLNVWTYWAD